MKQLEKLLNLEPIEKEKQELIIHDDEPLEKEESNTELLNKDFNLARDNMLNVLKKSNEAANKALLIAEEKEDARSFEALNGILGSISSAAMNLLELHSKKTKINSDLLKTSSTDKENNGGTMNVQNANIFVGSPKQLNDMLKSLEDKKKLEEK